MLSVSIPQRGTNGEFQYVFTRNLFRELTTSMRRVATVAKAMGKGESWNCRDAARNLNPCLQRRGHFSL